MRPSPILLKAKRHSEVMRRMLAEYARDTTAIVDGRAYHSSEFSRLLEEWATDARVQAIRDFRLHDSGGANICGFERGPSGLWIIGNERAFAERLAAEGLVRLVTLRPAPLWLQAMVSFVSRFTHRRPPSSSRRAA